MAEEFEGGISSTFGGPVAPVDGTEEDFEVGSFGDCRAFLSPTTERRTINSLLDPITAKMDTSIAAIKPATLHRFDMNRLSFPRVSGAEVFSVKSVSAPTANSSDDTDLRNPRLRPASALSSAAWAARRAASSRCLRSASAIATSRAASSRCLRCPSSRSCSAACLRSFSRRSSSAARLRSSSNASLRSCSSRASSAARFCSAFAWAARPSRLFQLFALGFRLHCQPSRLSFLQPFTLLFQPCLFRRSLAFLL